MLTTSPPSFSPSSFVRTVVFFWRLFLVNFDNTFLMWEQIWFYWWIHLHFWCALFSIGFPWQSPFPWQSESNNLSWLLKYSSHLCRILAKIFFSESFPRSRSIQYQYRQNTISTDYKMKRDKTDFQCCSDTWISVIGLIPADVKMSKTTIQKLQQTHVFE